LIYSVTLDRDNLNTTLVITNDGDVPFEFQTLMHTYFNIKVRTTDQPTTPPVALAFPPKLHDMNLCPGVIGKEEGC
jgi:hypothetical protein